MFNRRHKMKRSLNCVPYKTPAASGCFVSIHENKVGIEFGHIHGRMFHVALNRS